MRTGLAGQEPVAEFLNRIVVFDLSAFAMVVVLRKSYVSWVTNDVNDSRIARVEALMALDDPRSGHPVKVPLGGAFWIRNQLMYIRKICRPFRVHQVSNQKARPGVARFRK